MARQLHSAPAAAAITLVVCVATTAFMIFVLLPAASVTAAHQFASPPVSTHIGNITRAVGVILGLGYLSGLVGWIVLFVLHRDGKHRLASLMKTR